MYFIVYRPDQRVDDATAHRAIQAASDGAVAVLSYSYDHLNRDFGNAKSHLTGGFLTYYNKFTDDVVAPTAQQGQLTTTAKVIRSAVSELHPDSAVVLVFVDQTTASVKKKDPEKTQSCRPGHTDKGQRFLADREIRPGRMSAANLVLTVTWSAEAV